MLILGNTKGNTFIIGADIRKYATNGDKDIMGCLKTHPSAVKNTEVYTHQQWNLSENVSPKSLQYMRLEESNPMKHLIIMQKK